MGISLIVMLCTCNIQILACRGVSNTVSMLCPMFNAVSILCPVHLLCPWWPGPNFILLFKYRENMLLTVLYKYDYRWSGIISSGLFHVRCVLWHEMKKTRIMIINNNVGQDVNINFHIIDYTKRIKKMI